LDCTLLERERKLIFEYLSLENPESSSVRYAPVLFEKPEELTFLDLSSSQISTLGPRLKDLENLDELMFAPLHGSLWF